MADPDPFRPPDYVAGYSSVLWEVAVRMGDLLRRIAKTATIVAALTIIFLPAAPGFAIFWGVANLILKFLLGPQRKRAGEWFQRLAESRQAAFADIGTYLGSHPLIPEPGRCAIYLKTGTLAIEHEEGTTAEIPLPSIGLVQPVSEASGAAFGAMHSGVGFLHQPVKQYLEIGFTDDKGFPNKVIVGGLVGSSAGQWANYIASARYRAT